MEFTHPYSRYGLALILQEYGLNGIENIKNEHLQVELIRGLGHFRVKPNGNYKGAEQVKFGYMSYDYIQTNKQFQGSGLSDEGIFLSPCIIASDQSARLTWNAVEGIIKKLNDKKEIDESLTMGVSAISAKFNNGKKSQGYPKSSLKEVVCTAITNITPYKPCLAFRVFRSGKIERTNTAIIPALPLNEMIKFISFFKKMLISETEHDLMFGRVSPNKVGSGKNETVIYTPWRPNIYNGNFPNAPKSSSLGSIALLGAIGEWAKKANNWEEGMAVLDSLVDVPIYMISYGNAKSFTYNHFIIDLAKDAKLNTIIDAVYYTKLFNSDSRAQNKNEYQAFDLFASRFLQLFNHPAFKDFLAFRAEYPNELKILFTTYFTKMEKINIDVVKSAKELGRWLNYVGYLAAKADTDNKTYDDLNKAKAKVLVEMESSAFSAKSGHALIAQVITRGGRLSQMDAPPEAALFIEKTCSGELPLDSAKDLLMAFSRVRNRYEKPITPNNETEETSKEDTSGFEE